MNKERDKFLTEAMGECYHNITEKPFGFYKYHCNKCGVQSVDPLTINFSTWEGFGKLWVWSQSQEWFNIFMAKLYYAESCHHIVEAIDNDGYLHSDYISPDNFANAVYEYLKEYQRVISRPLLDNETITRIEHHYSEKDGVPVKYACTTELRGTTMDVFYRKTPHPTFGNSYFGIYRNYDGEAMITNADSVEELSFDTIKDSEGYYHYSRYRHDFVQVGDNFIDGGRDYTRRSCIEMTTFKMINGQFEEVIECDTDQIDL